MKRPWMVEARGAPDGGRMLALCTEHGIEIYRRVAPLSPTIHAAASVDEEVDRFWRKVSRERKAGMRAVVSHLARLGQLHARLDVTAGTDILSTVQSHETYLLLVTESGWSVDRRQPGEAVTASGIRDYSSAAQQVAGSQQPQFSLLPEGPQSVGHASAGGSSLPVIALRVSFTWSVVALIPENLVSSIKPGEPVIL